MGLDFRQNIVEVIQALNHGRKRRLRVSARGNCESFQTALIKFFRIKLYFVGNYYQLRILARKRREAELSLAAGNNKAYVAVLKPVCAACVANGVDYLLLRPRHIEHYCTGGTEKPVYVFVELKHVSAI